MSRREKGWFDLSCEELKDAASNLREENLRDLDTYMVQRIINVCEEDGLISSEEARGLREHLDSLTKT
ncbi:MAG: hypothetical protein WBD86_03875 [Microgenomates group bacterium]